MQVEYPGFGAILVDGERFEHDVVLEGGQVRKRRKGPSRRYRDQFGHTPLSVDEALPWSAPRLVIGTGAHGRLPIMPEVVAEARRRGVDLVTAPTTEACGLLDADTNAVLHVTC